MNAPLIAGNDVRSMDPLTASILMNREVIAVNQDPSPYQGARVWQKNNLELWVKPVFVNQLTG
jgi:alpha-galactosidase